MAEGWLCVKVARRFIRISLVTHFVHCRNQNFHENFIGTYLTCYYIIGDSWVTIWHAESAKTFMGISLSH